MPASPVVDLHRWRAQSRSPRPAATQDAVVQDAATPAPVLPLPPAGGRGRYSGQVGPTSPFGPVMAFGLRARPGTATEEATGTTGTAAGAAGSAVGAAVGAGLAVVPEEPEAPVATSWARGVRSRARAGARAGARTDARGASRGPRR